MLTSYVRFDPNDFECVVCLFAAGDILGVKNGAVCPGQCKADNMR